MTVNHVPWMDCPYCSLIHGEMFEASEENIKDLCGSWYCYDGSAADLPETLGWPKDRLGHYMSKCPSCGEFDTIKVRFSVSGSVYSHSSVSSGDHEPEPDFDGENFDYEFDEYQCYECNKSFSGDVDQFIPVSVYA